MAEPDDLLGKADALMARHRPGQPGSASYAEIPVLDEVVDMSRESDDLPVLTELVGPALLGEEQLEALAANMRASLLAALQPEIDALIDERLYAGLAPLVERLFGELCGEMQLIARDTLTNAIKTAVERELERRKSDV